MINLKGFKQVWDEFANIPINNNDEILERFYHFPFYDFPKGTDKHEIWHWLEEKFDISIGKYNDGEYYKQPCEVMYHLFTNGTDEYEEDTENILGILNDWIKDGCKDIRVYKQTEWDAEEGIFDDGDVIFSLGNFPI